MRRLEELRQTFRWPKDGPTPEELIREDRDRGHRPPFY